MTLPFIAYSDWTNTRITLHLILQIIGKIRLKSAPRKNHWWYITQYVSTSGFTTGSIPFNDGLNTFEIILDVYQEAIVIKRSTGDKIKMPLKDGLAVAEVYVQLMTLIRSWGLNPQFINQPLDMGIDRPFDEITDYHHFDWSAIRTFWQMMLWNDGIMKAFSGRFYGKTCPVQIYWHHLDLAVTRFSGRTAPKLPSNARLLEKDAYSHEVISFGFWAGDDNLPEPAYYAYTAPSPEGLDHEPLEPKSAFWMMANGSPMAILKYQDVLKSDNPRATVLAFLESAYQAGAKCANWDIEGLSVPALEAL